MKFEDIKKETPQDQSRRETQGVETEVVREAERFVRPRIHELLQRVAEEPDKKHFVVDQISSYGKTFFHGKEHLLNNVLSEIDATDYHTDGDPDPIN